MNLRSTLLLFVSLLLIAGAALADPAGAPAPTSTAPVAAAAPAPAPGLCIRNSTKAQLPDSIPAFQNKQTLNCGSCSVPTCRGVAYNSTCKIVGTNVYKCIAALGNDCSDGTPQCQCWFGPLP
ncbi:MAG TPA: hypothetical protein VGM86_24450 [Thermoanaerobaculia bacterium]|jgi:hypothetical protein